MPAPSTQVRPGYRGTPWATALVVALLAVAAVSVWTVFGPLTLVGGAVLAPFALGVGLVTLWFVPQATVVLAPALIPLPLIGYIFPYELMLGAVTMLVIVRGARDRSPWLYRLEGLELLYLAFAAWSLFTGLWSDDGIRYVLGVRRIALGFVTIWTAFRVVRLVSRRTFELSIVAAAATLSLATLARRFGSGLSMQQALEHRGTATDLGWGWANYIAALLLIMTPLLMYMAFWSRDRVLRWCARPLLPIVATVQAVIIARGALILFIVGIIGQVAMTIRRRRLLASAIATATLAVVMLGPWGEGIIHRFSNLRELSSGTIRIWYFREGWRRTVDNWPWGIGLNQGYSYPDKLQGLDPHNYWFDLGAELGLLGLIGWAVLLVVVWTRIARVARDPDFRNEGLALMVTFWVAQIHTLVEPTFQGTQYTFLFFWIIGGVVALHRDHAARRIHAVADPRAPA